LPDERENGGPPDDEARARPFWSGTITFGLVSIPVSLYPGNRSLGVSLRMLDRDGTPLARRYFCSKDEKELDDDEIVRGYELDGEYVVVTDEELEALEPDKSRDIDLRRFVPRDAIDPIWFERAYYLTPAGGSTKAYRLLAETMERSARAGIATFVMRGTEYLVAILADHGILRAETLRFAEEVRTPHDVGLPEKARVRSAEVKRIEKAMRKLAEDELDSDELADVQAERLLELVARKQSADQDVVAATELPESEEDDVIDLMEVIKRSMRGGRASATVETRRTRSAGRRRAPEDDDALDGRTRKELYERARALDIEGRSEMTKKQLIDAIRRTA
jgi:DNA end-binding protein Ku